MPSVLYLSYTGLLEPLGQSQVLNYLEKLSEDHKITILSFEKPEDLIKQKEVERLNKICAVHDIEWVIQTYHRTPRLFATLKDVWNGVTTGCKICREKNIELIHARAHVPALIAYLTKKLNGLPYIFDMRAFWPEEMLNAGRITKTSPVYKAVKWLEQKTINSCDHLVVLTHAAERFLKKNNQISDNSSKTSVIPTCVNLERFKPITENSSNKKGSFNLGVVGTTVGWVDLARMLKFFKALKKKILDAQITFITRDSPEGILSVAESLKISKDDLFIRESLFRDVPTEMNKMDAGMFFYKPYVSEIGRAPTKMGEFLACGVPCVGNSSVGDVQQVLSNNGVGVVLDDYSPDDLKLNVEELIDICNRKDISQRCRKTSEEWFSLEKGVNNYDRIYNLLAE